MKQLGFLFTLVDLKKPVRLVKKAIQSTAQKMGNRPALEMGAEPDFILKHFGKSFLTGWLKVKNSVRF